MLNGLRGIAVLLVLAAHIPQIGDGFIAQFIKFSATVSNAAYLGVDLFFVLSGFLITRILIHDKRNKNLSFKQFYLKRALRIFPIYYISVLVVGVLVSWKDMAPVTLYYANYFFALHRDPHPMSHTWSLAVEEHFYLVWPFVISYFSLANAKKVTAYVFPAIALITAAITVLLMTKDGGYELIYRGTTYRVLSLSLGSFLAFNESAILNIKRTKLFFGVALVLLAAFKFYNTTGFSVNYVYLPTFSAVSVFIFLGVISLENSQSRLRRLFVNRPLVFIGQISYGIYLFHYPILYLLGLTQDQTGKITYDWAKGLAALVLCFVVPIVFYYSIEKPCLRFKEKLTKRKLSVPQTQRNETVLQP